MCVIAGSLVSWGVQGPDLTLGQLLSTVEECCPQTAYAVKIRFDASA